MSVLVDTNILVRAVGGKASERLVAETAVDRLRRQGELLVVAPQVLQEWWVVATRPSDVNGLGMDVRVAGAALETFERLFAKVPDRRGHFEQWRELVVRFSVAGKSAHDARLVSTMIVHGIQHVLTFNVKHFRRYPFIRAISPMEIVSASASS